MRKSPLWLFLFVTAATTGAIVVVWPDPILCVGAAVAGSFLLHLHAHVRIAGILKRAARSGAASPMTATAGPETRSAAPSASAPLRVPGRVVRPDPPAREPIPTALSPEPPASAPEREPAAKPRPAAEATGRPPEDPKIDDLLKVTLGASGSGTEEVSFLPPYASGEESFDSIEEADDEAFQALIAGTAEEVEPVIEPGASTPRNVPIPRHFALGTVAIIRDVLTPADVAQVLVEQRKRPRARFGEVAVELGLLSEAQLQELLRAQEEGLFTDEEIRSARARIKAFREMEPSSAG